MDHSDQPWEDRRRNHGRRESKTCGVCGDRALGYNFNAVTCESCKAFFRRNALRNKEFRCPFNDACEVNAVTRRFCQRCRLKKCLKIGMKKEWILSEEEKQKKKKKIAMNRERKRTSGDTLSDSPSVDLPSSSSSPTTKTIKIARRRRTNSRAATESQKERLTPYSPLVSPKKEVEEDYQPAECTQESYRLNDMPRIDVPHPVEFHARDRIETTFRGVITSSYEENMRKRPRLESCDAQSEEIPSSSVTSFEEQGLVAGLLRSDSQSPQVQQKIIKSSVHSSLITSYHGNFSEYTQDKEMFNPGMQPSLPEFPEPIESSPVSSVPDDKFEFSIHEALSLLQPGCRTSYSQASSGQPTSYAQSVMDSIVNTAISAEYSAFLMFKNKPGELNSAEKLKIQELLDANELLLAPLCEDANFKDSPDPSLMNVINLTEIAIRRLIKMSKKISCFKSLCQEDQIALLKAGCIEILILKSVSAYDPDKDSWKIKQDQHSFKNIKLKVLKTAPGNVYEEHKKFTLAFKTEWRQDLNIMLLLSAIVLFTPERPFITHPDAIRHEQSTYVYLLKRYLEVKCGACEGRSQYYRLLERISHLHILNEDHVRVFIEANPNEMQPLLIEIFDLKQS